MSAPGASTSTPSPSLPTLPVLNESLPVRCASVSARINPFTRTPPAHVSRPGWQVEEMATARLIDQNSAQAERYWKSKQSCTCVGGRTRQPKRAQALTRAHARTSPSCSAGHRACVRIRLCVIQCAATQPVPRSLLCCCASDQICLPQPVCHLWRVHTCARTHT